MNYFESVQYIFAHLPMYQRIGPAAYKANLDNTYKLMHLLNQPHLAFRCVHVAGTNGKGSTSHLLASIFQEAGYKTGLYTSPHLKDFRERIRINGKMIPKRKVTRFINNFRSDLDLIAPSFFEMSMALAFQWFRDENIDIAIVEVGMGGRLDSTNVIQPDLSIITNIGLDHTGFLGDTIPQIAVEKAGIIKPETRVVIGQTHAETAPVFEEKAKKMNAIISFADQQWTLTVSERYLLPKPEVLFSAIRQNNWSLSNWSCPLAGIYQNHNIITVLESCIQLVNIGYRISKRHIKQGIANVILNTEFKGRWTVAPSIPPVLFDTGHNHHGLSEVMRQLKDQSFDNLHIVLGMVEDKDHIALLSLFPEHAQYYFCKPSVPRGFDAEKLLIIARNLGLKGKAYNSARSALKAAQKAASRDDLIFVGGSTFTVADAI